MRSRLGASHFQRGEIQSAHGARALNGLRELREWETLEPNWREIELPTGQERGEHAGRVRRIHEVSDHLPIIAQHFAEHELERSARADHHDQAPGKSGKAESPCKSMAVCQSAFAVPLLPQTAVETVLLAETTEHDLAGALAAPSRPPDPTLRPPIQL